MTQESRAEQKRQKVYKAMREHASRLNHEQGTAVILRVWQELLYFQVKASELLEKASGLFIDTDRLRILLARLEETLRRLIPPEVFKLVEDSDAW